jgi:hypothetical protein
LGETGSGNSGKNLRRVMGNLRTLTNLKKILPTDITMENIRGFIANANNKQDVLIQLAKFDENNIAELGEYIKNKGILTFATVKGPVNFIGTPSSDVFTEVNKRLEARSNAQKLLITDPDYDSKYNGHMKVMRDASEKSAELMADIHFGKSNEIDLSLPNTTSKQGQFDRVYKTTDPQTGAVTWNVVECKGGASELGSRQGHQQCTKPYIESVIANLKSQLPADDPKITKLDELLDALNAPVPRIRSYRLKQPFTDEGILGATEIVEFSL